MEEMMEFCINLHHSDYRQTILLISPAGLRFTKIRKKREILVRFEKKDGKSHIKQVKNRWKCCTIKDKPKNGRRLKKETRKDEK